MRKPFRLRWGYGSVSVCFISSASVAFVLKCSRLWRRVRTRSAKPSKKTEDIAKKPDALLVFQDEVHFTLTALVTWIWALIGSRPKVKSAPGRKSVAYSGFVIPSTGKLWVNKPGWFTYETVIASIRDFLANNPLEEGGKYYMVMDNAPWHRKAKRLIKENLNGIYQDIVDKVVFVYLPPYSPDLNPIEQVGGLSDAKSRITAISLRWRI